MRMQRHLQIVNCATEEPAMETALKIAFATTDMKTVDQHFGSAESFVVYAVDPEDSRMAEVVQFGKLAQDGDEGKLAAKMDSLAGCAAVYAQAMGASAIAQLSQRGIQGMKVQPGTPISLLVTGIQDELKAGPSAWIARALQTKNPDRFEAMAEEAWDE